MRPKNKGRRVDFKASAAAPHRNIINQRSAALDILQSYSSDDQSIGLDGGMSKPFISTNLFKKPARKMDKLMDTCGWFQVTVRRSNFVYDFKDFVSLILFPSSRFHMVKNTMKIFCLKQ